ncbi:hypothetical protein Bbelb_234060 [Branchiostoma belcheri]|nr:hypothetical protein Bbelb_234060 [Branchiostoma belcheri]
MCNILSDLFLARGIRTIRLVLGAEERLKPQYNTLYVQELQFENLSEQSLPVVTTKETMLVWFSIMLVMGCIPLNDSNRSELVATTYTFVGRSQFTNSLYRDQSTLQMTTDPPVKVGTDPPVKVGTDPPVKVGTDPPVKVGTDPPAKAGYKKWRDDFQCGPKFPLEDGSPAECDPDGEFPCCSPETWCGKTADHCDCQHCVDYSNKPAARCPTGYIAHDGAFYKVYNQNKTYDQAREQCAADGGLLAMPKNKQLDAFLFRLKNALVGPASGYVWFGLSDEHREGEWKWADGTPHNITADWGNWGPNQPDNFKNEDCAHYYYGWWPKWNDIPCDSANKFICQLAHDPAGSDEESRDEVPCNMTVLETVCPGKLDGSDYRGNLSVTRTGKTCQRWDVNVPHSHRFRPEEYPDELVENYCRNPDSDETTLWCYTTDPSTRWEYCNNPTCLI